MYSTSWTCCPTTNKEQIMSTIVSSDCLYHIGQTAFEGALVFEKEVTEPRPAVVVAPNWMGVTANAIKQAEKIAAQGYVVLVADLYGQGKRPTSADEAGQFMLEVKDTPAEVERMQAAIATLLKQQEAPVAANKIAAVGFCFGGHCALELARSGADINAAVSFHGGLDTSGLYAGKTLTSSLLVLDGASDPLVPREQLAEFAQEMTTREVDWQLISYAGAVHSFTDPTANVSGVAEYNHDVSERAFKRMFALLEEVF
jgi:dienelactone hydrolase